MFTLLTAWVSQRILTVTAVSVLTVAAVPTTLVIVSRGDDHQATIAVVQPVDDHSRAVLISAVKKAGDGVIARLDTAEASCDSQLTKTVSTSKLTTRLQPTLSKAKSEVHSSVAPVVTAIKSDEDRFAHLTYITPQDEQNELDELNLIEIIALGTGTSTGTITVTCQTVTITIQETINLTVIQEAPCATKEERDTD